MDLIKNTNRNIKASLENYVSTDLNYMKSKESDVKAGNLDERIIMNENEADEDINRNEKLRMVKKSTKYNKNSGGLYKTEAPDINKSYEDFYKLEKNRQDTILNDSKIFDGKGGFGQKRINDNPKKNFALDKEKLKELNALREIQNSDIQNINPYKLLLQNDLSPSEVNLSTLYQSILLSKNKNEKKSLLDTSFSIDNTEIKNTLIETATKNNVELDNKNITKLENIFYKINEISNLNQENILELIKKDESLTINNIYKSKFQSVNRKEDFTITEELREDLKGILKNENIGLDNLYIGELFVENEIPITNENINKFIFLNDLDNNIDYENVFSQGINNINYNENIFDINIYETNPTNELENYYFNMRNEINNVTNENINSFSENNQYQKTINNLILNKETSNLETEKSLEMRKQINDIKNHMTQQAITRLSLNGINIGHMPISKAQSTLKNADKIDFATNLKLMNVDANRENILKMGEVYNKIPYTQNLNDEVYGDIRNKKISFNMNNIDARNKAYEEFATAPSKKYRDSYNNIEDQINDRLKELSLDDSIENIKAYKILSKNAIDINEENLQEVKTITSKLDNISERLNPTIIAKMIKDEINPLDMKIENVIDYINRFEEEFGINNEKNISKQIYEMDKNKNISDEERKKIVALYRAINIIRKNDDVALGITLKHERNLTLENLFDASRIYEQLNSGRKTDLKIDDASSYNKKVINENNIKSILENKLINDKFEYNKSNLDRLNNKLNLTELISEEDMPLEDYVNRVNQNNNENLLKPDEFQKNKLENVDEFTLVWMQTNGIQGNVDNIETIQDIIYNPDLIIENIDRLMELEEFRKMKEVLIDSSLDSLKSEIEYRDLLKDMSEQLSFMNQYNLNKETQDNFNKVKKFLQMQNAINNSGNTDLESYPIKINDATQMLNIHILDENFYNKDKIETIMSLSTNELGKVQIFIELENNNANLKIVTDNDSLDFIEKNKSLLINMLSEENININHIELKYDKPKNIIDDEIKNIENKIYEKDLFNNLYNKTI